MSKSRLPALACLALLAIVSRPHTSLAVITLDANFDHGSLCLSPSTACHINGVASSVNGNTVTLIGRDNYNNSSWKWFYFRADGVDGQQVTFEIDDDFATGGSSLNNLRVMYSYDQTNWEFFDNNDRSSGTFSFNNNGAFSQNSVYVAYGPPYPYQRAVSHTGSISTSPWVSPTASGNGTLVIGQSPGGTDDIGRNITPKQLYGYQITDPSVTGPKAKIVLLSGVHSNETLGNFTLEGLVDFLVSDELAAAQLRRYAEFYVYPMANPDGRFAGYNRSTVQRVNIDPNRAWNPPDYFNPNVPSPTLSDIETVGEAMRLDTGEDIDYLIDFHSTVNPSPHSYHYGLILPEWQNDPFWVALRGLEPAVITGGAALNDYTGAKFGRDVLNAEFSATFETVFPANENIDRYLTLGRNFGLAWHNVFHLHGDLNADGQLNEQDWLQFIAGAETSMSGLTEIERYAMGDLDGDGVNSVLDFVLFKNAYITVNGAGSFDAMLAGVPEPSSSLLALLGVLLWRNHSAISRHDRATSFANIHGRKPL